MSDKIIRGKTFTPAPEGTWNAVCVDVWPFYEESTPWGNKTKTRLTWELDAKMDDGRPFIVSKSYTVSLHEKSGLYKDLKSWRGGKAFTAEEIDAFDLENVLGKPCQLVVVHNEKDEAVYANIIAVLKADPAKALKPSGQYVRKQDREPQEQRKEVAQKAAEHSRQTGGPVDNKPVEDRIPFRWIPSHVNRRHFHAGLRE